MNKYRERAKALAEAAPPVRAAPCRRVALSDRMSRVATKAAAAVKATGGSIVQARKFAAQHAKAALAVLRRGKRFVKESYYSADKATWAKLEVIFALLTDTTGSLEKRTRMLLETLRRSVAPVKGAHACRRAPRLPSRAAPAIACGRSWDAAVQLNRPPACTQASTWRVGSSRVILSSAFSNAICCALTSCTSPSDGRWWTLSYSMRRRHSPGALSA